MRYIIENRKDGSVEVNDSENNGEPVFLMAYYADGRHKTKAKEIVFLLNHDDDKKPSKFNFKVYDIPSKLKLKGVDYENHGYSTADK